MKAFYSLLLVSAAVAEICGGFTNAQCSNPAQVCLNEAGKPAPTGTCQDVVCGGFANVQCPEGQSCLDKNGALAPTGTCQIVSCPAFKCVDPCANCTGKNKKCEIIDKFLPNGCKSCPTGKCTRSKKPKVCGGIANVQCPEGQKCLNAEGVLAPSGTCQVVTCPAVKCAIDCDKCSKGTKCVLEDTFTPQGCLLCPKTTCV